MASSITVRSPYSNLFLITTLEKALSEYTHSSSKWIILQAAYNVWFFIFYCMRSWRILMTSFRLTYLGSIIVRFSGLYDTYRCYASYGCCLLRFISRLCCWHSYTVLCRPANIHKSHRKSSA